MKKTKNIFISLVLAVTLLAISAISVVSLNPTAYAAAAIACFLRPPGVHA